MQVFEKLNIVRYRFRNSYLNMGIIDLGGVWFDCMNAYSQGGFYIP